MKLDWDKPMAEICGPSPVSGARYIQNGRYFNPQGLPVEEDLTQKAAKLEEEGFTHTEIGIRLGVTRQKVTKMLR